MDLKLLAVLKTKLKFRDIYLSVSRFLSLMIQCTLFFVFGIFFLVFTILFTFVFITS